MAVISKNAKAKIQLCDLQGRTLCTYSGINASANANSVALFADGVSMLRNDTVGGTYLVTEEELEDTEEA